MYVLARNNSLVAIDAATGKEIWVHANLRGIASRGINYWESKDRKDRRLILQINHHIQEIDARTGKSILTFGKNGLVDLREGLDRDPNTIARVKSDTPGRIFENLILLGPPPGKRSSPRRATCARTTSSLEKSFGPSGRFRSPVNSDTRHGRRTPGDMSAGRTRGERLPSMRKGALRFSRPAHRPTTCTAPIGSAPTSSAIALSPSMPALESASGTTRWFTTISGTTTRRRRRN